jgi:hypothetical protein
MKGENLVKVEVRYSRSMSIKIALLSDTSRTILFYILKVLAAVAPNIGKNILIYMMSIRITLVLDFAHRHDF